MKGDFLEGSRGEGERGLNHHGTGDRVMDPLTVGDGAVWLRRMSQERSYSLQRKELVFHSLSLIERKGKMLWATTEETCVF